MKEFFERVGTIAGEEQEGNTGFKIRVFILAPPHTHTLCFSVCIQFVVALLAPPLFS